MRLCAVAIFCFAATTTSAQSIALSQAYLAADYLPVELRARVEKLKQGVVREPTNVTNQQQRAATFWDWVNAYALSGSYVPVDATAVVARLTAYPSPPTSAYRQLDALVREFTVLDEEPDAIGELRADLGPFEAKTFATIRQTYTVGRRPIVAGGGFLVARHFNPGFRWQTTNPRSDNFISIASSNAAVAFEIDSTPVSGMHGGFRGATDQLVFRVSRGRLATGDTVTITYGDRSRGSRGILIPYFSSDRMPLPLYLDFDGSGDFFSLPIAPIKVSGARVAGVRGFAPSIVASSEPFELSVRAEDPFLNRATGAIPGWVVLLNGEPFRTLPAGTSPIQVIENIRLAEPGVYRFAISSPDGAISGASNPVVVRADPGARVFWGDTHAHSGFAEGIGTPERLMIWARDDARLDFVAHTEHDIWLDDLEWSVLRDNVRSFTREGAFVAFLGYEWTIRNIQGGHHNVLFRTPGQRTRIGAQRFGTLSALYQGLRENHDDEDVVVIPHAHQVADYRTNDPKLERLVEIMSQHGTFEWFGRAYLDQGHQVGFIAASDDHASQPGYGAPGRGASSRAQTGGLAAVRAPEKTVDAIFDAMRSRNTYATSGERIVLDFTVNGASMGTRAASARVREIRGTVVATAPIDEITVIKNNEPVWQRDYARDQSGKLSRTGTFLLTFESSSKPVTMGDNPRGWRVWRGRIAVDGATIEDVRPTDFFHPERQDVNLVDANTIDFATMTRGEQSSLELELANMRRSTAVTVSLLDSTEYGGPLAWGSHQKIPGAQVEFELRDLEDGLLSFPVGAPEDGQRADRVRIRQLVTDGVLEAEFEFEDAHEGPGGEGDFYYLRVLQTNGASAWSSPVWIGGYPTR